MKGVGEKGWRAGVECVSGWRKVRWAARVWAYKWVVDSKDDSEEVDKKR